ncbi:MAG: 4'-phosphopantetheinyl transferase superfamily protein [Spirochaeta sp.]|jgi:phosphopantetheinyl transferase (holo-ACP synthase)|nr:4'-phosphopantetheinyl transferase superfamily protein [Spirochaeta sp.]
MFLGNDLVHWSGAAAREKETLSHRTARFIDRVLHEREHPILDRPATLQPPFTRPLPRVRALWALWAAKEAAFKAAVKAIPGLAFSPRSFRIELLPSPSVHTSAWPLAHRSDTDIVVRPLGYGIAHVRDQVYEILWEYHAEFVHALALGPLRTAPSFGDHWESVIREMTTIPINRASVAVRHIALQLLSVCSSERLTISTLRIVRDLLANGRLGPPVFHDGAVRNDLDLTMTHDGPWGAVGLLQR